MSRLQQRDRVVGPGRWLGRQSAPPSVRANRSHLVADCDRLQAQLRDAPGQLGGLRRIAHELQGIEADAQQLIATSSVATSAPEGRHCGSDKSERALSQFW